MVPFSSNRTLCAYSRVFSHNRTPIFVFHIHSNRACYFIPSHTRVQAKAYCRSGTLRRWIVQVNNLGCCMNLGVIWSCSWLFLRFSGTIHSWWSVDACNPAPQTHLARRMSHCTLFLAVFSWIRSNVLAITPYCKLWKKFMGRQAANWSVYKCHQLIIIVIVTIIITIICNN